MESNTRKRFLTVILVLCAHLTCGLGLIEREMKLDENFHVSWVADLDAQSVTFEVVVKTKGFIGFGLSPQGGMSQADVIIGGQFDNGTAYFTDRWSTGKSEPQIDKSQDWKLVSSNESDTHTTLKFTRAIDTCDEEQDLPINNDTTKFIWSYGQTDVIEYHQASRGVQSVNILDTLVTQVDTSTFGVWHINVSTTIPNQDTVYWCTAHKLPTYPEDRQIVGFRIKLDNELSLTHNHHVILHQCVTNEDPAIIAEIESYLDHPGGACYRNTGEARSAKPAGQIRDLMTYCRTYLYVWAKGGDPLFLPEDIGIPLNYEGGSEYYLLEIHYDNPNVAVKNLTYPTGLEVYTTTTLRPKKAGVLTVGAVINPATLVPPNVTDFVIDGHCSPDCTEATFPEDGINIFNILLHSHLAGRKLKLRHFRGEVELPWVSYDNQYDFNYQQNRALPQNVKIMPGDQLTYECVYDSSDRDPLTAVIGGLTTRDEMCETFFMYYPRLPTLRRCGSSYPVPALQKYFGDPIGVEEWDGDDDDPVVTKPANLAGMTFTDVLNKHVNWTTEKIAEVQKMLRYDDHQEDCSGARPGKSNTGRGQGRYTYANGVINYPPKFEEYVPAPSQCRIEDRSTTNEPENDISSTTDSGALSVTVGVGVTTVSIFFSLLTFVLGQRF